MPKIDLGKSLKDSLNKIEIMGPEDTHYPTLFLTDVDDPALANLPDKGECVIRYKVVSRTHREEKGKKDCCDLRLEVTSITPPASGKKKNGNVYGDDARKSLNEYFKDKK